jgi:hypothetical protein
MIWMCYQELFSADEQHFSWHVLTFGGGPITQNPPFLWPPDHHRRKADWALSWCSTNSSCTFGERVHHVHRTWVFSDAFCAIFWLKQHSILPGLWFSNELISRGKGMLWCDFTCLLHNHLVYPATLTRRLGEEDRPVCFAYAVHTFSGSLH